MNTPTSAPAPMPVTLLETKMIGKGSLVAAVTVSIGKLVLHEVQVMCSHGRTWANPPSKPQINRDGMVVKTDKGKLCYIPLVAWADPETKERFSRGVVTAFEAQHGSIVALVGGAR